MKRAMFLGLMVLIIVATMAMPSVIIAGGTAQDSHKIANKWDASGTLTVSGLAGIYDWDGLVPAGETWSYRFHIKEAMDGEFSTGTVHFTSGDIDVVGNIEATKSPYRHWNGHYTEPILAAVGTAEYDDISYYFMFLSSPDVIWFALSTVPYDDPWEDELVWAQSDRAYQLLSTFTEHVPQFTLEPKVIHEQHY